MNMSASIACRFQTVSRSVSPFDVEDAPTLRLITSAERRLAAISKVVRVRVEFSKNTLKIDLPRSNGTFFTSRSETETNWSAVSRMRVMIAAGRPSVLSRWRRRPSGPTCRLAFGSRLMIDRRSRRPPLAAEGELAAGIRQDQLFIDGKRHARADEVRSDRQLPADA